MTHAIPYPTLETVFLDAGNTLVHMDFAFLCEGCPVAQATQKICHHAADRRLVVQNQNTAPALNDADVGNLDVAELPG